MDDPKNTASKASKAVSDGRDLEAETGGVSQDLGVVYGEMRSALLRFASRYFKKPQEIEDVVQEAFVKVIEAQHQRDIHSPKSYLFRTTRNLALTQLEKSSYKLTDTVGDLLPETDLTSTGTLEEQFESRQNFELFCRAVRQLPIKCQRVYILRRVYGFTHKEIAERMDISAKTVEAHLTKAIVRCSDYMELEEAEQAKREAEAQASGAHGKNKADPNKPDIIKHKSRHR